MKVAINKCYGGFGLSASAFSKYMKLKGKPCFFFNHTYENHNTSDGKYVPVSIKTANKLHCWFAFDVDTVPDNMTNEWYAEHSLETDIERHDPFLIQVIEELGDLANGQFAKIKIVEIPDGTNYTVEEYDGQERIAETHNTWG